MRRKALRAITAVFLIVAGHLIAVGAFVALMFEIHPWPGGSRDNRLAQVWAALIVTCLVGPPVAWWFLLPRARWWGIALSAAIMALWLLRFATVTLA